MKYNPKDRHTIKLTLTIISLALVIGLVIFNLPSIFKGLGTFFSLLAPFFRALVLAFLINIPMNWIENRGLVRTPLKKNARRAIAMILSYIIIFGLLTIFFSIVIPKIISSTQTLLDQLPAFLKNLRGQVGEADFLGRFRKPVLKALEDVNAESISNQILSKLIPIKALDVSSPTAALFSTLSTIFSSFMSGLLTFVFSIYILASKEKLGRQAKGLLYAIFPEKGADMTLYIVTTALENFHNFFTGQFLEAIILSLMNLAGMKILGLPFSPVVSVIIGFGALIPIVGALLAGVFGFLMILTSSLLEAVVYIIFLVILQQFDDNIVYPKVVGQSVGLPAIWVLFAIMLGGKVMGAIGMLVFVPLISTIYDLLSDLRSYQLNKKNINITLK